MKQIGGPDEYWSTEMAPSCGQWRDIAELACALLGVEVPEHRLAATTLQVRMRAAVQEQPVVRLPEPW
jgi:hypothetical protein